MASYLRLAWSFITFLYEDEKEEPPPPPTKWILYATHDGTQSSDTGSLGCSIFWNLSLILLAMITAYAIVCLYKNRTYQRYLSDFMPPHFVTEAITFMRNRLT